MPLADFASCFQSVPSKYPVCRIFAVDYVNVMWLRESAMVRVQETRAYSEKWEPVITVPGVLLLGLGRLAVNPILTKQFDRQSLTAY